MLCNTKTQSYWKRCGLTLQSFMFKNICSPPPPPANPPPFNDSVLGLPPHRHKNTLTDELWVVIPKNDKCPGAGKNNVYCSYMLET